MTLVRSYWSGMAQSFLLSALVGVLGLVAPYASKLYFDNVYPARDVGLLRALVAGVAAFSIASALMGAVRGYYTQVITARMSGAVALMYFNHLQHLPMRFFEDHRVGEVMSRIGDMRSALSTVSRMLQTVFMSGIYVLLVPPFLLALNWKLSLLSLVATPIVVAVSVGTSRISRRFMKQTAEANAEFNALQVETLSQIRTLKTIAAEPVVFEESRERTQEILSLQLRAAAVSAVGGVVNAIVRAAGAAVLAWYAWTLILSGDLSLGSFVAFSAYLGYLTGPVGQLAGLLADFQQSTVTFGRAFEYLDLAPEQDVERAFTRPGEVKTAVYGDITLDAVSFGYSADKPIVRDLSIRLQRGTITAIVGKTGSGKSTILRLLCGLEKPWSGRLAIDGLSIESISLADLRRQVGVVWQEPTLLRGTVWENLTLGLSDVSRDALERVVQACQLSETIAALPNGYETLVAEWGATVSGGQRQRFALARVLLRSTPILLLDETTSQLDVRTEESLLRGIIPLLRGRTVVLVTHRLSTAALANQVCLLEGGKVVGLGGHEELLRCNEHYRQLYAAAQRQDARHLRPLSAK
ncbi:peptidase domain-containing ABC transporter [Gemmatimonas sp.]|jgi:ABC-type bacteriocin/lantibiotic exporter with double-glycine peptidase domain|uniref:peptidase domain-containing ABC transporter n=2 Tax=Gemmatimonas sp. TaxID=1962908 RepID=UPI0025BE5A2F|nr:peptidase domain-containing ABC transporter [Gemmatimonas sp.]MCA2982126.1 peptidase domain-containing ABC transporter [Gemmatimonas sp.]MCA2993854.1 peptidase domain-containing ABC transporter [Gemmatimonas sp.]